jgi:hypothetical protein
MREMEPHSQGDSRRLYRWRDIASNTRGRISDLAAPLATLLRKRLQLHTAGMRSRQEVAIGAGRTVSLYRSCALRIANIAQSDFRAHTGTRPKHQTTKYPFCRLWLSRAKFAHPAESRLPRRRGCQRGSRIGETRSCGLTSSSAVPWPTPPLDGRCVDGYDAAAPRRKKSAHSLKITGTVHIILHIYLLLASGNCL